MNEVLLRGVGAYSDGTRKDLDPEPPRGPVAELLPTPDLRITRSDTGTHAP